MGVQTNQMPRSFDLYCQASCILFTLANQSISAHKKPTGMDKNLAPVSTMTTLQLEPRPLKQLQTLPVWITVPGWNQCQCQYTLLSNAPEKVFQDESNTMKLAHTKKNLFTRCEKYQHWTWEPSSSKNIMCSKGTQFSVNRPENKKIDKTAKK